MGVRTVRSLFIMTLYFHTDDGDIVNFLIYPVGEEKQLVPPV